MHKDISSGRNAKLERPGRYMQRPRSSEKPACPPGQFSPRAVEKNWPCLAAGCLVSSAALLGNQTQPVCWLLGSFKSEAALLNLLPKLPIALLDHTIGWPTRSRKQGVVEQGCQCPSKMRAAPRPGGHPKLKSACKGLVAGWLRWSTQHAVVRAVCKPCQPLKRRTLGSEQKGLFG